MAVARVLSAPGEGVGVVPSREALGVVRSWLPPPVDGDDDDDLDGDGAPDPDDAPRPARLGLGAKFLSHQRAQSLFDPVSRRLERQLGGSRARRLHDGTAARASGADPGGKAAGGQQLEEVEIEEEGRSTAFATKKRPVLAAQLPLQLSKKRRKKGGAARPS